MEKTVTYADIENAYKDAIIGREIPGLVVASGSTILRHRPDLAREIDPEKAYYVTKAFIKEVEA